jgi:valyl-tRNA synthetase
MLGDGAVAVHPSDERYAPIVGKLCEIPVGPKEHRRLIPIITDEYPDPDFGSGAVKITGAHDFNDYAGGQARNIPLYRLMDTKGAMRADGAPYAAKPPRPTRSSRAASRTRRGRRHQPGARRVSRARPLRCAQAVVADIDAEGWR